MMILSVPLVIRLHRLQIHPVARHIWRKERFLYAFIDLQKSGLLAIRLGDRLLAIGNCACRTRSASLRALLAC